jgi:magnesium transporter
MANHKRRVRSVRRAPPGSSPGTLLADPAAGPAQMTLLAYGPDAVLEPSAPTAEQALDAVGLHPVAWIDVEGLGDPALLNRVAERLGMHRLALEDAAATHQRAKVEAYGDRLFIVLRAPRETPEGFDTEQISLLLGPNFLVTFQEGLPGDCFAPVRDRIRRRIGRLREAHADYLSYALIDAVVDAYFPVLERMGERVEALEQLALIDATPETLAAIRRLRRDLLNARRAVWPLREGLHALLRDHAARLEPETAVHLRDCYDHCVEVLDLLEMYRDLAGGLMDVWLSSVSNRMNEVMKVLTVVSTVFIPMTFIAGVYGMNFKHMPELDWRSGYFFALALMAALGLGLLAWFWRRGWLRRSRWN